MEIKIADYTEWKNHVSGKSLPHFSYFKNDTYDLKAVDGNVVYTHDLSVDDVADYETNLLPDANGKNENFYTREPFASKKLKDGSSLFRRKHGVIETILASSEKEIIFTVPYSKAKINKLEIVSANDLDKVDLYVKSPLDANTAAAYGMPADILLNQFGFDVVTSGTVGVYADKSDYDADVYTGFQIIVKYKNHTTADKEVGFNLVYHEVVS